MPPKPIEAEGLEAAGIKVFPARICECGAVHDRPEAGCPECGSLIAREAGDAVFVADLGRLEESFKERVREELRDGLEAAAKEMQDAAQSDQERALVTVANSLMLAALKPNGAEGGDGVGAGRESRGVHDTASVDSVTSEEQIGYETEDLWSPVPEQGAEGEEQAGGGAR